MVRRCARGCTLIALLGALAWGLGGCWNPFAPPPGEDPPPPIVWEIRDTPQHTLDNLVNAYKSKNAEHYLDCLAEDFIFFMNEADALTNPPGYWGKAEERAIHEDMLGDNGADEIKLTFTRVGDPMEMQQPGNPPPPPHWGYTETPDLKVTVGDVTYWATASSLFELRIDQDQVGPEGETLWEICAWTDLEPGPRGDVAATDESVDVISFGRAKAMFRP
jgi:hypothetical protein